MHQGGQSRHAAAARKPKGGFARISSFRQKLCCTLWEWPLFMLPFHPLRLAFAAQILLRVQTI
jgi:hypothetical protein